MSSPEPAIVRYPFPKSILRVVGDPTAWDLSEDPLLAGPDLTAGAPAALDVVGPVAGKLLLAPRRAEAIALTSMPQEGGWVPCATLPTPYLYLPSPGGMAANSPGYKLAGSDTNVEALQQAIMTAMSEASMLKVSVIINGSASTVVVNGGGLPFVVLVTAIPTPGVKLPGP